MGSRAEAGSITDSKPSCRQCRIKKAHGRLARIFELSKALNKLLQITSPRESALRQ